MSQMKKRVKIKRMKREEFKKEVQRQKDLGNYYMVYTLLYWIIFYHCTEFSIWIFEYIWILEYSLMCYYVCQVHVDTPESLKNLSESTLKGIRQV